jgi:hypothetical protein
MFSYLSVLMCPHALLLFLPSFSTKDTVTLTVTVTVTLTVTVMMQVLRLMFDLKKSAKLQQISRANSSEAVYRRGLVFLGYAPERGEASWRVFAPLAEEEYAPNSGATDLLDDNIAVAVQVYNGETCFGDEKRLESVQNILMDHEAKLAAVDLVDMRGMRHRLAHSQLERIVG